MSNKDASKKKVEEEAERRKLIIRHTICDDSSEDDQVCIKLLKCCQKIYKINWFDFSAQKSDDEGDVEVVEKNSKATPEITMTKRVRNSNC